MEGSYWIYLVMIVVAIGFFLFEGINLPASDVAEPSPPKLIEFTTLPEKNIKAGQEFTVKIFASDKKGIKFIEYSGGKNQRIECSQQKECRAEITDFFSEIGGKEARIKVINSDDLTAEENKLVYIVKGEKTCIDGTPFGECSKEKPFFCQEGKPVENCSKCGCPENLSCQENQCRAKSVSLGIEFKKIYSKPMKKIMLSAKLKNESKAKIAEGTAYKLRTVINGIGEKEKQLKLEKELVENEELEVGLGEFELNEERIYPVKIYLSDGESGEKLNELELAEGIEVKEDNEAPLAPTGLKLAESGQELILSWEKNQEQDLAGYKVYKSFSASAKMVSYKLEKILEKEENSLSLPKETTKQFFVLTALDVFGNESEYSAPIYTS